MRRLFVRPREMREMVFFKRDSVRSAVQQRLEALERQWNGKRRLAEDVAIADVPVAAPAKPTAGGEKGKLSPFETELLKAWADD
jgi:hypothetical protein